MTLYEELCDGGIDPLTADILCGTYPEGLIRRHWGKMQGRTFDNPTRFLEVVLSRSASKQNAPQDRSTKEKERLLAIRTKMKEMEAVAFARDDPPTPERDERIAKLFAWLYQ